MNTAVYQQVVSGGLIIVVALAAVLWWKRGSHVEWRWFWAGAAIWTVGVALKFAVAMPLNPLLVGKGGPPRAGLVVGIIYCGLMTGVFEIGVTLAAGLLWKRLADAPGRAVAVGLGAGAFEALMLGFAALAGSLAALVAGEQDTVASAVSVYSTHTSLLWLAGPVERVFSIAAHTAARVLVLEAVARRKWLGFWAGFGWLSLMDALAGAALLTGMTKSHSIWLTELMFLPIAILSVPLTRWAMARWPKSDAELAGQQFSHAG
jgi:uncharacterized membrane protein YhfC